MPTSASDVGSGTTVPAENVPLPVNGDGNVPTCIPVAMSGAGRQRGYYFEMNQPDKTVEAICSLRI
jgi:hypothetical protein